MEKKDYKALLEGGYIEIDCFTEEELNQLFQILNEKMQIIYDFVLGYMDYINERHNYSSDEKLTMLEAHLLTDICDAPNIRSPRWPTPGTDPPALPARPFINS